MFAAIIAILQGFLGVLSGASLLNFFKAIFGGLACLGLFVLVTGCQPNTEPIERTANTMMVSVIKPAVDKAVSELSTRTSQLQGQGSLINPGYVIDGFANFGPGVAWRFSMRTDGVSANIAGATQADQGQATTDLRPPGDRTPATQPSQ